jgi:carbon storage regulator CsrA
MLVVTRRPGEPIVIELPSGELIEVVVLSLKGNQVKPSTDAPKHLPVVPKELLEGAAD